MNLKAIILLAGLSITGLVSAQTVKNMSTEVFTNKKKEVVLPPAIRQLNEGESYRLEIPEKLHYFNSASQTGGLFAAVSYANPKLGGKGLKKGEGTPSLLFRIVTEGMEQVNAGFTKMENAGYVGEISYTFPCVLEISENGKVIRRFVLSGAEEVHSQLFHTNFLGEQALIPPPPTGFPTQEAASKAYNKDNAGILARAEQNQLRLYGEMAGDILRVAFSGTPCFKQFYTVEIDKKQQAAYASLTENVRGLCGLMTAFSDNPGDRTIQEKIRQAGESLEKEYNATAEESLKVILGYNAGIAYLVCGDFLRAAQPLHFAVSKLSIWSKAAAGIGNIFSAYALYTAVKTSEETVGLTLPYTIKVVAESQKKADAVIKSAQDREVAQERAKKREAEAKIQEAKDSVRAAYFAVTPFSGLTTEEKQQRDGSVLLETLRRVYDFHQIHEYKQTASLTPDTILMDRLGYHNGVSYRMEGSEPFMLRQVDFRLKRSRFKSITGFTIDVISNTDYDTIRLAGKWEARNNRIKYIQLADRTYYPLYGPDGQVDTIRLYNSSDGTADYGVLTYEGQRLKKAFLFRKTKEGQIESERECFLTREGNTTTIAQKLFFYPKSGMRVENRTGRIIRVDSENFRIDNGSGTEDQVRFNGEHKCVYWEMTSVQGKIVTENTYDKGQVLKTVRKDYKPDGTPTCTATSELLNPGHKKGEKALHSYFEVFYDESGKQPAVERKTTEKGGSTERMKRSFKNGAWTAWEPFQLIY